MNFKYLHQLPQNIAGKIISYNCESIPYITKDGTVRNVYYKNKFFGSGISLGEYIILDKKHLFLNNEDLKYSINHEYGHCRQSEKLGWLYLIIVGLPSFGRNIYDRLFHKKWNYEKRKEWYYSGFPENWANKLGGIK